MKKHTSEPAVKRAALYIRVSSEEQAIHGLSLGAQQQALEQYAKEKGFKVVGLYADEGITARKTYKTRAKFMRMLEDVQHGLIDVILFIKLDRWFRNIADYYEVQRILDEHNVLWIATEERYDTTTANGRLNLNIRLSIAQDESDRTSERIQFVFKDKVRRGEAISGKVPFGYKIENKRIVPDDKTVPIARDIFNEYLSCRSIRQLRKYVMDKYGMVYTPSGMRLFLGNERYIGKAHGDPNFCEPIIDAAVFEQTQRLAKERAQRSSTTYPNRIYLFSSIVYCAECGNRLNGHVVGGKYVYYRCTKYEKLHLCIHRKNTSELVLEKKMLESIYPAMEKWNVEIGRKHTAAPTVDIPKIKAKMSKLKDLYLNDLIDREEYERDYLSLKEQLEPEMQPELPPKKVDLEYIKQAMKAYDKLDRPHRRKFWSRIVDKIVINNDDELIIVPARTLPY